MDQQEIHQVLDRAQQIESQQGLSLEGNPEVDALIQAGDEVGIKRESVLQALRERISVVDEPLKLKDIAFARLLDGIYHLGTVTGLEGDVVEVKFKNSAAASVQASAIRRFRGLPNEQVYCEWPYRGWTQCGIERYDPKDKMVDLSGPGGKTKWFALDELRLYDQPPVHAGWVSPAPYWHLYVAVSIGSAIAGVLITWLAMRR
ncbi:MAG: hypothetical protein HYR64_05905 [Fimbriimonas ginsengisoli]|uniref:Uncharacterized protein n=1 Tax=Fimbriimonas ginsengisoli TaxID=1005039 RepID=A0A931LUW3_FIMGI|nr:hypothetical protein [Fimbriimonas ginsengisoli]